jgi:hypothetical protein
MKTRVEDYDYTEGAGSPGPLFDAAELAGGSACPTTVDGPFAESSEAATPEEVAIALLIWDRKGWDAAIAIAEIEEKTGYSNRMVKTTVEILRKKHKCAIGPRHEGTPGYYWIVTPEDRVKACRSFYSQILAMWETLQVLGSREGNAKLLSKMGEKA